MDSHKEQLKKLEKDYFAMAYISDIGFDNIFVTENENLKKEIILLRQEMEKKINKMQEEKQQERQEMEKKIKVMQEEKQQERQEMEKKINQMQEEKQQERQEMEKNIKKIQEDIQDKINQAINSKIEELNAQKAKKQDS